MIMSKRIAALLCALLVPSASLVTAQESRTQVKKVPIQKTSASSGAERFKEYCAACHGPAAKGDGPAASSFKVPPADLTTLAKRHGGKFPQSYVVTVLENGLADSKSHGSKDMPLWGPLFGSISSEGSVSAQETTLRISNLAEYLKSLQSM
jgi:mono/diheme cytochrome c family protein